MGGASGKRLIVVAACAATGACAAILGVEETNYADTDASMADDAPQGGGDAPSGDAPSADGAQHTEGGPDAPPVNCDAYSNEVLADKPRAYWPLRIPANGAPLDVISGGPQTSTVGALAYQDAACGAYVRFDDGCLNAGNVLAFDQKKAFTVEARAFAEPKRIDALARIASWSWTDRSLDSGTIGHGYALELDTKSAPVTWYAVRQTGATGFTDIAAVQAATNRWTHLVMTYDQDTLILYVDGADPGHFAQNPSTGAIGNNVAALFAIGARMINDGGACSENFQGLVSDVAIYDFALGQDRVKAHYAAAN